MIGNLTIGIMIVVIGMIERFSEAKINIRYTYNEDISHSIVSPAAADLCRRKEGSAQAPPSHE